MSVADLQELQNKIKRDPESYRAEFAMQYRHFESTYEIVRLKPHAASKEFGHLVSFCSHVASCFPEETKTYPQSIMSLLDEHGQVLPGKIRMTLCSALILLRNRDLLEPTDLLPLFFRLFRCPDKAMRSLMFNHIVSDVKNINKKHANNKVNSKLQNFMYTMLKDNNLMAARMSLMVMTTLYKKNVWSDAKTVNVIATACSSKHVKLMMTSIRFFLNVDEEIEEEENDDSSEQAMIVSVAKDAFNIHHKNVAPSTKKVRKYKRALKVVKTNAKKEKGSASSFTALMLLHDPQGLAEKLFQRLKGSTESFEVKLVMMNMISRLIGTHELMVLNFYPFLQRYLSPHQKDITSILAYMTQAVHNLIPPDSLEPVVQTLANHFVNDRSSNEAMSIGLNTIREICSRQPHTMSRELLQDLAQYKSTKDKGVATAARSLISLFREVRPELLHKKDRGKKGQTNLDTVPMAYGAQVVHDDIDGLDLLRQYEAAGKEVPDEDEILELVSRRMNGEDVGSDLDADSSDGEGADFIDLGGESGEDEEGKPGDMDDEEDDEDAVEEDGDALNSGEDDGGEESDEDEDGNEKDTPQTDQKPDPVLGRILTDEDFEKIRRLKMMKLMDEKANGKKRKRDEVLGEDGLPISFVTTDFAAKVDPSQLQGNHKHKKATREEKMEKILQGREGREAFGAKKTPKGGGSTNSVKKRTKSFAMVLQSDKVRSKATRSSNEKRIVKSQARAKNRRGKTKRRN